MFQNQLQFYKTIKVNIKFQFVLIAICVWLFPTKCLTEVHTKLHDLTQSSKAAASKKLDDPVVNLSENDKFDENEKHKVPDDILRGIDKSADKNISPIKAGFLDAFTASISVILFTELGDKTFFIAAIMAMRHPRLIVFGGALSALALMTVLSVVFGMAATIIPKIYTYYISTALFAIFGLKMIYEGYLMKDNEAQEELEEVQSHLRKREDELERDVTAALIHDPESGIVRKNVKKGAAYVTTRVLMQAFTMTFLAEWGDRSQLTTIILAASKDIYGVITGGIIGHSICTGLAVIGGRMVAAKISLRTVTIVGGIVFLGFALYALIVRPEGL